MSTERPPKTKILLARAHDDDRWATLGNVDFLPVLGIEQLAVNVPLARYQAVVLTSANAARPDILENFKALPVYTVGDITAHIAHKAGCTNVISAKGTSNTLIQVLKEKLDPRDGAILYLRGHDVRTDLKSALAHETFAVNECVVYRTDTISKLPDTIAHAVQAQAYTVMAFFSPRGAQVADALFETQTGFENTILTGLSEACTAPLVHRNWKSVSPCAQPTFQNLYNHIKSLTCL